MNDLREEKVFKDPVHNYIYVDSTTIWDLINTKEFQRLRRIRQLGTSFYTFHGAEHSRFSHSLGVYEITRKIISQFERNGHEDWPTEERLLCLCAALLHDLGHGPFSHSVEKVFDVHHELWSCRMILEDTEVHTVLSQVSPSFPKKVAEVIAKTYHKPIVVSLISSQMDADRMDYLLRDAYFTGVNYGSFDLERILRMMRPYKGNIVVKESGMHAVEHYLMSRYQMYWQVYFHPVTRSSEIILRKIFQRAQVLYEESYLFRFMIDPLPRLFSRTLTTNDYLLLDESFIQMTIMQWTFEADAVLADLCGRFLNRRLFKYVPIDDINDDKVVEKHERLMNRGLDPLYYMEIDYPTDMFYDVYRPGEAKEKTPILLLTDKDEVVEISQKSDIVRSISGPHRGLYHLYYPGELE
jgi:HD superfamily phosphohydrolase